MVYFNRILIPTDMSPFSLVALEHAASLRLLYSSSLYMLYVGEETPPLLALHNAEFGTPEYKERLLQGFRNDLVAFAAKNVPDDIKITPVVRLGNPADEIKRLAQEEGIDLVVMATHGRTGFKHILMGSVAEKVVRLSNIPVLTVKPRPVQETLLEQKDVESELHLR